MSQILSLRLLLALLRLACAVAFTTTVDFETNDCGKQFTVQTYDQYRVKAAPLANPAGGADHCKVQFISEEPFRIYIQDFHTNDCTVTLKFYENDPSETREKYQLGCPPHEPPSSRVWTTDSGRLIVRLDKSSGTTTSYQFELVISTGSNDLSATAGGGAITTGAIIGIIVGVIAFLIIIVALVLYFVCKQMREKKEERMRQMEAQSPPVFTTVSSARHNERNASASIRASTSGSHRVGFTGVERERKSRSSYRSQSGSMRGRSGGVVNRAYTRSGDETASNPSTDFTESKRSYAISVKTDEFEKPLKNSGGSMRMREWSREREKQKSKDNRYAKENAEADDTSFTENRSSVKFDLSESDDVFISKNGKKEQRHEKDEVDSKGKRETSFSKSQKSKAEKEKQNEKRKRERSHSEVQDEMRGNSDTKSTLKSERCKEDNNRMTPSSPRKSREECKNVKSKNVDRKEIRDDRRRSSIDDREDRWRLRHEEDKVTGDDRRMSTRHRDDMEPRRRTHSESRRSRRDRDRYASEYQHIRRRHRSESRGGYDDSSRSSSSQFTDSSYRRHHHHDYSYDSDRRFDRRSSGRHWERDKTRSENPHRRSGRYHDDYDSDYRYERQRSNSVRSRPDRRSHRGDRRYDDDKYRREEPHRDDLHRRSSRSRSYGAENRHQRSSRYNYS